MPISPEADKQQCTSGAEISHGAAPQFSITAPEPIPLLDEELLAFENPDEELDVTVAFGTPPAPPTILPIPPTPPAPDDEDLPLLDEVAPSVPLEVAEALEGSCSTVGKS